VVKLGAGGLGRPLPAGQWSCPGQRAAGFAATSGGRAIQEVRRSQGRRMDGGRGRGGGRPESSGQGHRRTQFLLQLLGCARLGVGYWVAWLFYVFFYEAYLYLILLCWCSFFLPGHRPALSYIVLTSTNRAPSRVWANASLLIVQWLIYEIA